MPFLVGATLICVAGTALIGTGPFALSIGLFILANAAYQAGVQFYDSLLPEVTHAGNRGRISGIGVGVDGRSGAASNSASLAAGWFDVGAKYIGGCCRVGPPDIRALSTQFSP